jgi:formate dehydrogenase (coenzyme F420) beta subunit
MSVETELRDVARKLLEEGTVELFIGWERGSIPASAIPVFITDPADTERLVFDITCGTNPSVYFTKDRRQFTGKRVGVALKGCDARSMVQNIMEKQVERENVVMIGVPCRGVLDRRRVALAADGREVLAVEDRGDTVRLSGRDRDEVDVPRDAVLGGSCITCAHQDASVCDLFLGVPGGKAAGERRLRELRDFEALSSAARWERTVEEYGKCIRCYACRNVCPSCYCEVCFVDQNDPRWIGGTCEITDTLIFHLIRNLHVAGRCVECGACARACPTGVDLLLLNRKVAVEVLERFGEEAGMEIGAKPIMADFREDEKQEFIMG